MKVFVSSSNRRCHSNAIESAAVLKYLSENGVEAVSSPVGADVVVITACGSMDYTREYTLKMIEETAARSGSGALICVAGCMVKIERSAIERLKAGINIRMLESLDELDGIIKAEKPFRTFKERYFDSGLYGYLSDDVSYGYGLLMWFFRLLASAPAPSGFRKKMECVAHMNKFHVMIGRGCVGNCSYCAIKKARGAPVSRPPEEILSDISSAFRPGQVLNLVADDCGSYGVDTGSSLPELLGLISRDFPDLKIDLRYLNPSWLMTDADRYLEALSGPNLNSVNLCIQSGSDRLLAAMNRNYRISVVTGFVDELKRRNPRLLIRTHVITGYPGETWGDFFLTLRALGHFDMVNAYLWSPPPGGARPFSSTAGGFLKEMAVVGLNIFKLFFS